MLSRVGLVVLLGILVVIVISTTVVFFQSKPESKTLENPYILTANALSGRSITMHITGVPGISADEAIVLNSAEWHTACTAVVGAPTPEIFTDKYGRVKVQFHWDRQGKLDDDSSCWIRVSTHWAGKNWGVISVPRIGQEVIIDYLEGDPDKPIIIGKVFGEKPAIFSTHYTLADQGPIMETVILPSIIQWQFKDLQTGETFCGGVDTIKHELLDCKQILQ
jgi:hypothetical protein